MLTKFSVACAPLASIRPVGKRDIVRPSQTKLMIQHTTAVPHTRDARKSFMNAYKRITEAFTLHRLHVGKMRRDTLMCYRTFEFVEPIKGANNAPARNIRTQRKTSQTWQNRRRRAKLGLETRAGLRKQQRMHTVHSILTTIQRNTTR